MKFNFFFLSEEMQYSLFTWVSSPSYTSHSLKNVKWQDDTNDRGEIIAYTADINNGIYSLEGSTHKLLQTPFLCQVTKANIYVGQQIKK